MRRWIVILGLLAGCASTKPVPRQEVEQDKAQLDAAHRQAQRDYDAAEAESKEKQP